VDEGKDLILTTREPRHFRADADACVRELVAFYEISAEIAADSYKNIDDWISANAAVIGKEDAKDFQEILDQLAGAARRMAEHMRQEPGDADIEPFEEAIAIPREELREIFFSFYLSVALPISANRSKVTSRAFLIAAESSFEILFSHLVHVIYKKNPSALARSDYSFTLEQLTSYDSMDAARDALVTHKIEGLLRESVEEWRKWLNKTINIKFDEVIEDWPATREIFIRRNMLVHTDGRVSKRYIDELRNAGAEVQDLVIGQSLAPSAEYLQNSLQRLIALVVLLTFRIWSRLEKSELDAAAGWLAGNLSLLVSRRMWTAVCLISRKFSDVSCRRNIQLSVLVNGWLAQKKRDGIASIVDEVSSWDVSGLESRYRILKATLLDSISVEELEEAVREGHVTRFELATHPLFDKFQQVVQPVNGRTEPGDADAVTDVRDQDADAQFGDASAENDDGLPPSGS
jgi:hypothetical protein